MKISLKDKKVLVLIVCLVLFTAYYFLFHSKQFKKIDELSKALKIKEEIYDKNDEVRLKVEGIDSELKIMNEKLVNIRNLFPPSFNEDEILIVIRDLAKKSGIEISSITFSEPAVLSDKTVGNKSNISEENNVGAEVEKVVDKKISKVPAPTAAPKVVLNEIKDEKLKSAVQAMGIGGSNAAQNTSEENFIPDGKAYEVSVSINAKGSNSQVKGVFPDWLQL